MGQYRIFAGPGGVRAGRLLTNFIFGTMHHMIFVPNGGEELMVGNWEQGRVCPKIYREGNNETLEVLAFYASRGTGKTAKSARKSLRKVQEYLHKVRP